VPGLRRIIVFSPGCGGGGGFGGGGEELGAETEEDAIGVEEGLEALPGDEAGEGLVAGDVDVEFRGDGGAGVVLVEGGGEAEDAGAGFLGQEFELCEWRLPGGADVFTDVDFACGHGGRLGFRCCWFQYQCSQYPAFGFQISGFQISGFQISGFQDSRIPDFRLII
jgi:hypothetical protein